VQVPAAYVYPGQVGWYIEHLHPGQSAVFDHRSAQIVIPKPDRGCRNATSDRGRSRPRMMRACHRATAYAFVAIVTRALCVTN
jgi:hypothetical protein